MLQLDYTSNGIIDTRTRDKVHTMNKEEFDKLTQEQQEIINSICELVKDPTLQEILADQLAKDKELLPHIKAELKKAEKNKEVQNLTVYDILDAQNEQRARRLDKSASAPDMPEAPKSKALIILERALRRQALHNKYPAQPNYNIKTISANNSALINYMTSCNVIGTGAFDLPVMPKRKITTYTMITFDEDKSDLYEDVKKLTEIERSILDRIYTLKKYANEHNMPCLIDGYIIASCMPGAGGKVTPQEAEYYNSIIEKFRDMKIYIDATDELRARGIDIPEGDKCVFDDYCISALRGQYRTKNGDIKDCYILRDIPLPHNYAEKIKQIITISADLFDIKETMPDKNGKLALTDTNISMTKERQNIVNYLLRRIFTMRNDFAKAKELYRKHEAKRKKQAEEGAQVDEYKPIKDYCKQKHVIDFDTLYKVIGQPDPNKIKASRLREFCKLALTYWQAKGIIKSFEIKTGKNAQIKIILEE